MPQFQNEMRVRVAACATLNFFLLASDGTAVAQNVAVPATCASRILTPSATDAAVTLSPKRGWQMVGRDIDLTITSSKLTATSKPLVCFRWKLMGDTGQFVQADSVRIVQQPQANQQPPTLKVAVPVPLLKDWPLPGDQLAFFTDDPATAIAEVRILVLGADGEPPLEDIMTKVAIVGEKDHCNIPKDQRTDLGTVSTSKNWQPVHGEIEFVAKTFAPIPNDISIRACFRWKLDNRSPNPPYLDPFSESENNHVLDRQSGMIKLAVTVPDIGNEPNRFGNERVGYFGIPYLLMPKLDVRMLFLDANLDPILDAGAVAWVTSVWFGVAAAFGVVSAAFLALWLICRQRFTSFGRINPILCLIASRNGFASLSQFQIMLWTFVVIASAAYVMALSGTLIPITSGTLILLGISGATAVISKAKGEFDATAAPPPLDTAAAKKEATRAEVDAKNASAAAAGGDKEAKLVAAEWAEKAKAAKAKVEALEASLAAANARAAVATAADQAKSEDEAKHAEAEAENKRRIAEAVAADAMALARIRHPRWSDLVMDRVEGRELDVSRVQMLCFTLMTAAFVAIRAATSYAIPDIPEGYLLLMGISNSVFVGSQIATNPTAK
jgi:hypothetical protein